MGGKQAFAALVTKVRSPQKTDMENMQILEAVRAMPRLIAIETTYPISKAVTKDRMTY